MLQDFSRKKKEKKKYDWNLFKHWIWTLPGILAVWAHVGLQQKQDLSVFQIHISDKWPVAEKSPTVAQMNQRIKETPGLVEETVIC